MNVKIHRFWPVPVLLFCVYCLYTLVSDSYEVLYKKRNETDTLLFLPCVKLSWIYPNKTEIELGEVGDDLYDYFDTSDMYDLPRRYDRGGLGVILNRTKSGGYVVLNRRVCLLANDQKELEYMRRFLSNTRVFFAIQSDTFDFVQMGSPSDKIDQLIVRKKEPSSDCDKGNRRFLCLNECLRSHFRLSRYFYQANETGSILLDFSESNRTIQESERTCFRQCKRENCQLVQLILIVERKEPKTFEAEPVLKAFDFWVEIVGLIFSFVGLFFDQFASTATKLTKKLTRSRVRRRKVKVGLFCLNLTIILLSLAYCGYLCVRVALEWQADVNLQEREMTRNLIHPKTVHLAICVDIEWYKNGFYKKTMWEIERATNRALNDTLEGIYVRDGGRSFRTDYQVHPKILFNGRRRCFSLSIQSNHQTIPSRPKLIVKFKERVYYKLYVLSGEENLNSKSFWYSGGYAFQKRIVKRLKCMDYTAKNGNCTGRQKCVDRCIARKFMTRYNKILFDYRPVIDRDWFSPLEWNTSSLMVPDWMIYDNISEECEEEVPEKECDEIKFEETVYISQPDEQALEIDLQFDVVHSVEELPYSLRMALDLLGIQSIFFGFILLQLFWMVYQFTKPRWRWRLKDKTDKVVWFIVCLLFSLGCSWTTVRMLDGIVNKELVPTEHYEVAERVQMPTMVFCLPIDQKLIDRNHPRTGGYLEEMTGNITTESTFESITYLNESNEWIPFDLCRVERFFLLNMKCFRFQTKQKYNRNQFIFSGETKVFRVNFKWTKENLFVHFMTQSRETAEFSKIYNLNLIYRYIITHEPFMYEYEDRFGFFRRHFPPIPEGDVGDLRQQLLKLQANEPQRRTLSLPVEEEHFGLEFDEDRFEQLHSLQRKKNSTKRTNLNYRQIFHLVFLRRVMHFKNEVNYATLTLALLNLLSLWLELGVLDLRPFLVRLHDHLLIYLYLHLPILLLRRLIKALIFCCRYLRKVEPHLYERIDPEQKEEEEDNEEEDSPNAPSSEQNSPASVIIPD